MKQRLFNALACASLLLFVVTASVIVRGFFRADMLELYNYGPTVGSVLQRSRFRVVSGRGILYVLLMSETDATANAAEMAERRPDFEGPPDWSFNSFAPTWPTPANHQWLGCGYSDFSILNKLGWSTPRSRDVRLTLWIPLTLFAILPSTRAAISRKRRGRLTRGECLNCGYNLVATPQRCPECGTVPVSEKAKSVAVQS